MINCMTIYLYGKFLCLSNSPPDTRQSGHQGDPGHVRNLRARTPGPGGNESKNTRQSLQQNNIIYAGFLLVIVHLKKIKLSKSFENIHVQCIIIFWVIWLKKIWYCSDFKLLPSSMNQNDFFFCKSCCYTYQYFDFSGERYSHDLLVDGRACGTRDVSQWECSSWKSTQL